MESMLSNTSKSIHCQKNEKYAFEDFRVYSLLNSFQNRPKDHPQTHQKRSQISKTIVLGCFWCQFAPRPAPGPLQDHSCVQRWRLLGRKCRSKGRFWEPQKSECMYKIELLRICWPSDPPKIASGRGFGKNTKIEWKNDPKIHAFCCLETTFGVIIFAYFTLLSFSKKSQK